MHRLTSIYIISSPSCIGRLKLGFHSGTIKALKTRYRTSLPDHCLERFISHPRAKEIESIVHETLRSSTVRCIKVTETDNNSEWYEIRLVTLVDLLETCIRSMDALRASAGDVLERTGAIVLKEYGDIDKFRTYLPRIVRIARVAVIDGQRCILRLGDPLRPIVKWTRINSRDEMVAFTRAHINLRLLQQLTDESIEIWNTIPYTLRKEWNLEIDERFLFLTDLAVTGIGEMLWTMKVEEFVSAHTLDPLTRIEIVVGEGTLTEPASPKVSAVRPQETASPSPEISPKVYLLRSAHPRIQELCPEDLIIEGSKTMRIVKMQAEPLDPQTPEVRDERLSLLHRFACDTLRGVACTVTLDATPEVYRICGALIRVFEATDRTVVCISRKAAANASHPDGGAATSGCETSPPPTASRSLLSTTLTGIRDVPREGHALVICERTDKKVAASLAGRTEASILMLNTASGLSSEGSPDETVSGVNALIMMYLAYRP